MAYCFELQQLLFNEKHGEYVRTIYSIPQDADKKKKKEAKDQTSTQGTGQANGNTDVDGDAVIPADGS